ncbi:MULTISPECIES: TetR/AcrR family transcriptional regulator [Tsukamurella]|uniref:TetR/AcrR family transcriptional regulator n=2 Tax=Tsukamurella TaxID=2060 RepID=A0A5C5S340_9ACTN|nr:MULTISPECIES: TetR/AcrR family transcriptional regulator [Tsukamurella]NMD57626.1 TetR/AcrR family transcriptional regulator [Tsukamurella columbiensis]TWS29043.1 TetR/AcrR family transcriptional regulator [Tsukamurella conjunctivitidis]
MTRPGASLPELLLQAGARTDVDDADAHVYRAALRVLSRGGTRRTTVEKIAAEAGMSRMTLFRRFGSKDDILAAALAWSLLDLFEQTMEVIERTQDVAERVQEVFVLCCRAGRAMLPSSSPEERAALFADDRLDPVGHGVRFVSAILSQEQTAGNTAPGDTAFRADAIVRLTTACFTVSPPPFDLTDEGAARAYARAALVSIVS